MPHDNPTLHQSETPRRIIKVVSLPSPDSKPLAALQKAGNKLCQLSIKLIIYLDIALDAGGIPFGVAELFDQDGNGS